MSAIVCGMVVDMRVLANLVKCGSMVNASKSLDRPFHGFTFAHSVPTHLTPTACVVEECKGTREAQPLAHQPHLRWLTNRPAHSGN